jgi:hypothetical protein
MNRYLKSPLLRKWFWIYVVLFGCTASSFAQLYPDEVLADHPVSYWRFETNLLDETGGNELLPAISPDFVAGPGSDNRAFSTNNGRAWAAGFGVVELFDLESFSYEMWINPAGVNQSTYLLMRRATPPTGGSGENSLIFNYNQGRIELLTDHGEFVPVPGFELADNSNTWHHIVMVYDEEFPGVIFYLDGQEVDRVEGLIEFLNSGHDEEIYIGATRESIGEHVFNGYIDEVAVYTYALTANQVAAHYNAAFPSAYTARVIADNPTVYWRFEDSFKDEMKLYDLVPSGMRFVNGPKSASNYALYGRVSQFNAQNLYNFSAFTYELWFNAIGRSSQSYLLFRRAGNTQQAIIYAYNPNQLEYFSEYNPRPAVTVPNQTDAWHHAVFVYDDAVPEMRIYLDGVLANSRPGAAAGGSGNQIHIGGSDMGDTFDGYIDEVAIYDFVLGEERILAHYNSPFAVSVGDWSIY